jgi:predicted DNA-binding protein
MEKHRVFSVTVPTDVYQRLIKLAAKRDEKLAQLVRRMIKHSIGDFESAKVL